MKKQMARRFDRAVDTCRDGQPISDSLGVSSRADCASKCSNTERCEAFDTNGRQCFLKSSCPSRRAKNSSCNPAVRQGWCGYRVAAPVELSNVAVVQSTHVVSPSILSRFALAQSQLQLAGALYRTSFLMGDEPTDRCGDKSHPRHQMVAQLRRRLGKRAVWCIDARSYVKVWPSFFDGLKSLPWRHRLPGGRPGPHWRRSIAFSAAPPPPAAPSSIFHQSLGPKQPR